jgi:hypothetical protein
MLVPMLVSANCRRWQHGEEEKHRNGQRPTKAWDAAFPIFPLISAAAAAGHLDNKKIPTHFSSSLCLANFGLIGSAFQ